jgi:hypothetical protein
MCVVMLLPVVNEMRAALLPPGVKQLIFVNHTSYTFLICNGLSLISFIKIWFHPLEGQLYVLYTKPYEVLPDDVPRKCETITIPTQYNYE